MQNAPPVVKASGTQILICGDLTGKNLNIFFCIGTPEYVVTFKAQNLSLLSLALSLNINAHSLTEVGKVKEF